MDYIVNKNPKFVVEVRMQDKDKPALQKDNINAYSRALRKIMGKGGRR